MRSGVFVALLALAAGQPPAPPYVREKTVAVFESSYEPSRCVEGSVFYTTNGSLCAAYDLPSLKRRWSFPIPGSERGGRLAVAAGVVYLATEPEGGTSHLHALDGSTGRVRWKLRRSGQASPIAVDRSTLYLGTDRLTLSAVDLKTRAHRWNHAFPNSKDRPGGGGIDWVSVVDGRLLINCNAVTFCLSAATGKELWRQQESYVFQAGLPVVGGIAAVPAGGGTVGRELRSGTVRWRAPNVNLQDGAGVLGRAFVGIGGGRLRALDARSGRLLWSKSVGPGDTSGGNQYVSVLGQRIYARGLDRAVVLTGSGGEIQSGSAELAIAEPVWSDSTTLVSFDGLRLLKYRHGKEVPLPAAAAERRRKAADLVRRFDSLDDREIARLTALGADAFEPVLAALRTTCAAHDRKGENADTYPLYQKYHALAQVLRKITTRRHTGALVAALQKEQKGSSARPVLLSLAAEVGDPAVVTPYFLEALRGVKTPGYELYESETYVARRYVVRSRDPRAVEFLLQQLQDAKSDPVLRLEAYLHVAGSGNPEAVRAVLSQRSQRTLLPPLEERVLSGVLHAGEFGARTRVLSEKGDAQGRTWGLLTSGVLGSSGDLWLAEKVGSEWKHVLFTGVSTAGISPWAKPAPPEPRIGGKTGKQLPEGDWLAVLRDNPDLRRDTDEDGLTDLVERRLGTDPKRRDTDEDGDPDGVDPWPNAPARALSDEEQVYAAVYEARFHSNESAGPAILFAPEKLKPFEMPGRSGPTVWTSEAENRRWSHPLEHHYGQGIGFIQFEPADREGGAREAIRWNRERTEATVGISVYYGGLNGSGYRATVRKIGSNWVVVSMERTYVS